MMGESLPLEKKKYTFLIGFHLLFSQRPKYPTVEKRGRNKRDLTDHCLEPHLVSTAWVCIQTFQKIKLSKRSKRPNTSLLAKLPPLLGTAPQASQDFTNLSPQIPLGQWSRHLMTGSPPPHYPFLWWSKRCPPKRHQHTDMH